MSRTKDMTRGNPTRLIFSFALPLILGNAGQQIYMITDTVIVGQGVGLGALASLGATDWIYYLVLWPVQFLTQGFAILITQNIGSGNAKNIEKSIAMSTLLCLITGTLISVIFPFLARPMLTLLKTPDDIFGGALSYITIMYAGTLIVMAYSMASAILRAFGDGKTPLIAMVIAAVVNIFLDLLFIMLFKWGIVGAAAATIIAQFVSFLYCLLVICKIPTLSMRRSDWIISKPVIKRLLGLGLPLAFSHVAIVFGGMIVQLIINGYGFLFIAGFTAATKLIGILESSAISFGFATVTYIAQNWGANKLARIGRGIQSAVWLSVLFCAVISAAMILFGKYLLMMFISSSDPNAPLVLDIAYRYLIILSVSLIFLYFLHVYRSALQGLGDTVSPMISGFLECIGRISIACFLPVLAGESGLFFAEPTAWLLCAVYVLFMFYHTMRKIRRKGLRFSATT